MKTYAQFDADGKIHSIVTVDAPAGVRAMVDVEPGLRVTEVDAAGLAAPTTEADVEKVHALARDYRVSAPAEAKAKLTKAK